MGKRDIHPGVLEILRGLKMIKLYDHPISGNCYKVRLALNQLGIRYEKINVDIFKGE